MIQAVGFNVNQATLDRITRGFQTMPARMLTSFGKAFEDWGQSWQGHMAERFRGGDGELHTRTGALKRSLTHNVTGAGGPNLKLKLASAGPNYARLQEQGGIVRPVRAKFICIPTEANKTAAGVARFSSPRDFIAAHPGETFFMRSKSGALLLMWRSPTAAARKSGKGAKGEAIPMWLLVRQVDIPGPNSPGHQMPSRLGFFDTWKGMERERRVRMAQMAREIGRLS